MVAPLKNNTRDNVRTDDRDRGDADPSREAVDIGGLFGGEAVEAWRIRSGIHTVNSSWRRKQHTEEINQP